MSSVQASAKFGVAVVPSDVTPLYFKALWVGVGGTVVVELNGTPVTFLNVPGGQFFAVNGTKVMATGTDATDMVAVDW